MERAMVDLPILRTSERGAWKSCPWKWQMSYRRGLVPKGKQADARWFGIGVHEALGEWYQPGRKRGRHPARFFAEWVDGEIAWVKTQLNDEFNESVWVEAADLGIAMLNGYVEQWGRDDQWDIVAIEAPFRVRLHYQGKPVAIFSSRWDGVIRDRRTGKILLLENKTAGQILTAHLDGDDQAMSYLAVANQVLTSKGILKPGQTIAGIQYNFLRKAMPDDRPRNKEGHYCNKPTKQHYVEQLTGVDGWDASQLFKMKVDELDSIAAANHMVVLGDVSKNQPSPRYVRPNPILRSPAEMRSQLKRMSEEVYIMNLARSGAIPIQKNRGKNCPWCDFWDPCLLDDSNPESAREVIKASYRVDDPYKDIREGNPVKSAAE